MSTPPRTGTPLVLLLIVICVAEAAVAPTADAGSMINDPQGYAGYLWGATISESKDLVQVDSGNGIKGYALKQGPPRLGEIAVDSVRLFTIDGQFARVVVRYRSQQTHEQVITYLQRQFGPIDRTPGKIARRLNEQYNWRGTETEINLTYQAQGERGYLFFESRTLAPRFNENITETGE